MAGDLLGVVFGLLNNGFKKCQIHGGIGQSFGRTERATESTDIGKFDVDSVEFHKFVLGNCPTYNYMDISLISAISLKDL